MTWDETTIAVRFNEVDAYQVAWHGHYVAWMEIGRTNLTRRFGLDPFQLTELGWLGPVVQVEVKYLRPARCHDALVIRTTLEPGETATLVFLSEIIGPDGSRLATGRTIHALTDLAGTLQFRLPQTVAERLARLTDWLRSDAA